MNTSNSADGGPAWRCVKMTDERRGLWFRRLPDGTVQVRAGREGDDDIAIVAGEEGSDLAACLERVCRISKSPQPFAKFADLEERRKLFRQRTAERRDCEEGKVEIDGQAKDCFVCNGFGCLCDVCGDPTNDYGLDVCERCSNEEGDE